MKPSNHLAGLGELLQKALRKHPAFSANPIGDWEKLAGEQLARYSQPKSLKDKVLVILAYDSIWKHHIELNKDALIDSINRGRKESVVDKIVVRVGEVPASMPVINPNYKLLDRMEAKHSRARGKRKVPIRKLTPEETALLSNLPDPELRSIGKRLLRRLPERESSETVDGSSEL